MTDKEQYFYSQIGLISSSPNHRKFFHSITAASLVSYIAFRVVFSSARQPIVVARTKDADKKIFWTSIPEGRQREAEGIGKLIEEHFNNLNVGN